MKKLSILAAFALSAALILSGCNTDAVTDAISEIADGTSTESGSSSSDDNSGSESGSTDSSNTSDSGSGSSTGTSGSGSTEKTATTLFNVADWVACTKNAGNQADAEVVTVDGVKYLKVTCADGEWNNLVYFEQDGDYPKTVKITDYKTLKFTAYVDSVVDGSEIGFSFTGYDSDWAWSSVGAVYDTPPATAKEFTVTLDTDKVADLQYGGINFIQIFVKDSASNSPIAGTVYLGSVTAE
ncbi:MAG: hypothetical protein K5786_03100 [Treponema sp.]|nr:hypothetical protein [Treponema sp.]